MAVGIVIIILSVLGIALGLYLKHRTNISRRPQGSYRGLGLTIHPPAIQDWPRLFDVLDAALEGLNEELGDVDVQRIWIEVFDVETSLGKVGSAKVTGVTSMVKEWPWSLPAFKVSVRQLHRSTGEMLSATHSALLHEIAEHAAPGLAGEDIQTHDAKGKPLKGRERWSNLTLLMQGKLAEKATKKVKKALAERTEKD